VVLSDASFDILHGEKVGFVGQNGTGKSTLFNIIYGLESPGSGEMVLAKSATMGYLTQQSKLEPSETLIEAVSAPTGHLGSLAKKVYYLEQKLENTRSLSPEELDTLSQEYASTLEEFASSGGYGHPSKVEGILETLGFSKRQFNVKIKDLSGGERTKARLGTIILEAEGADILLLDEPTNHLDIDTTEWLEDYMLKYPGAVFMVAHDRYFLDKLVTKVIELEGGETTTYGGNYSTYMEKKAKEYEDLQSRYKKQQKEVKRQEEMIEFMHRIYHYKSIHKTQQKKLDKMEKIGKPQDHAKKFDVDFGKAEKSGKDTIDIQSLTKKYGEETIIGKCDLRIEKGEKFGIIGANGSGKTTLIRLIMGEEAPTTGQIKISKGTNIGYYDQEQDGLVRGNTVIQEIQKEKRDAQEQWVRNFLGGFMFRGKDVYKKVFVLSGGERARLAIAKLLLSKHNTLILDEPTNYLDVLAKESVEKALIDYQGTLLMVSHDRAFLDSVATGIIEIKDGVVTSSPGNYSEFRKRRGAAGLSKGGDTYLVMKKFTDWKTWAIENKALKKK